MKCLTNKWREGAMLLSFLLISSLAGIFTACDDIEEFNLRNCSRDIS